MLCAPWITRDCRAGNPAAPDGVIVGTVTWEPHGGPPPARVTWPIVSLYDANWNWIRTDFGEGEGYRFSGLATGDYYVKADI